ncbi:unnamed protein product [Mytilus edulis]|uniref:Uncharacterized protein n=1 Tax=Mytilus edulis TaxID=6550 RepID=A0A8S3RT72_MYTED|nr:unnamed protein product [Mytilus edulis]
MSENDDKIETMENNQNVCIGIGEIIDIERYNSYRKLTRITAYVMRFATNCRASLVSDIVQKLLNHFEEKITSKFECKIREATGKLDDKLDTLMIENEDLRERIRAKDRVIENLVEKVGDNNNRSIDALKLANYNEQYSRKHNIRMLNFPEKRGENLKKAFVELVNSDLNVNIEPSDVLAIHRIPGKEGYQKPVIVKVRTLTLKYG